MDTTLTIEDIQIALRNYHLWNKRSDIMIPNLSWGLLRYEADFVIVDKKGFLTEVEIKRSLSDLKADFKKVHKHDDPLVFAFYYCLPMSIRAKALAVIREHFAPDNLPAVIYYDENGKLELSRYGGIPNRGGRRLTLEERLTVTRLLSIRYWNEKEKARKNGTFITTQD